MVALWLILVTVLGGCRTTGSADHGDEAAALESVNGADSVDSTEEEVAGTIEARIEAAQRRLESFGDGDPARAELLHELGDIHREYADEVVRRTNEYYLSSPCPTASPGTDEYEDCRQRDQAAEVEIEEHLQAAAHRYGQLLTEFPDYGERDRILLEQGVLLYMLQREEESAALLTELIEGYPDSQWRYSAHAAMGDHFFFQDRIHQAVGHYEQALESGDLSVIIYSRYKLGWSHYFDAQYRAAVEQFAQVYIGASGLEDEAERLRMERDGLRELVRAVADLGDEEWAIDSLFDLIDDREKLQVALERLAEFYRGLGQMEEAQAVTEALRELQSQ